MAWARETPFARMRSSALGKVCTSCVCAVITPYFLAPWVTWWLLILGWCEDPALTKICFSYLVQLPCLHACVCWGGGIRLPPCSVPSIAVAVYFFLLELCDAASCSVLCAIRIAQRWCERGKQLHEGFAWFWELAGTHVCLVGKRVQFWGEAGCTWDFFNCVCS